MKTCIRCEISKSTLEFSKHSHNKDNLDGRCKLCISKAATVRNKLRKTAPPIPDVCECCNKPSKKSLCLDHSHETEEFRGWICENCNRGIGQLDDNLNGVLNAALYLLRGEDL